MFIEKIIWLVTHGETRLQDSGGWCPDPAMTEEAYRGMRQIEIKLLQLLQDGILPEIQCGTGKRQYQVAQALGLNFETYHLHFSGIWGDASTLIKVDGVRKVLLGHGLIIDYSKYDTTMHVSGEVIKRIITALSHNTVICSGRPVLIRLGMKPEDCHSGALYSLKPQENGEIKIELVQQGRVLPS